MFSLVKRGYEGIRVNRLVEAVPSRMEVFDVFLAPADFNDRSGGQEAENRASRRRNILKIDIVDGLGGDGIALDSGKGD